MKEEIRLLEVRQPLLVDLAQFDPVDDYLCALGHMLVNLSRQQIYAVINVLFEAWKGRKQVFILGNGGSASTASHMANDLCKLTIVEGKPRMKAVALTDNVPLITAWGNDEEYAEIFAEPLRNFIEPGDVVIAISTSGNSPNVLRAVDVARNAQAISIGLTGKDGGALKHLVDYCIFIPDEHMGRQEDGHLILDHVIAHTLRWLIAAAETE